MSFNPHILEHDFSRYSDTETAQQVMDTAQKLWDHFSDHEHILVSTSGGSDSDTIIHLIHTFAPEMIPKCHFVFVNTGLEYAATKRHLDDLEKWYGITIERIRGMSVVTAVRRYGFPILNKMKAHYIDLYLRGCASGEKYIFNDAIKKYSSFKFTDNQQNMVRYLKTNGIRVSEKCCTYSKKKPMNQYVKQHNIDMNVTGERKAEGGGQRAQAHKSCFEPNNSGTCGKDKFMPLWWWTDNMKADYKAVNGIVYSDCYEIYKMHRTGCVGCPFGLYIGRELEIMHQFEPQLYKACMNVFGEAYRLTDQFNCRRKKILPEAEQLTWNDVL